MAGRTPLSADSSGAKHDGEAKSRFRSAAHVSKALTRSSTSHSSIFTAGRRVRAKGASRHARRTKQARDQQITVHYQRSVTMPVSYTHLTLPTKA